MKREELELINMIESKIRMLVNDIDLLKDMKDKDSKAMLKDKQKLLKGLQDKLDKIKQDIRDAQAKHLENQRKLQQQMTKEKIEVFRKYMKHIGSLDNFDDVDMDLRNEFLKNKNYGPIRTLLRKLLMV